jgi:photosystem II stability/assembly factor-like uncharacterized protein
MKKFLQAVLFISILISTAYAQSGSWVEQTNPLGIGEDAMVGNVQFVSPVEGWISGSRGDLLHTTNAGDDWQLVTPFPDDTVWSPSDLSMCMSWVNSTHGWKINSIGSSIDSSQGVVVHQTTDGGNTWQKKLLSTTEGDFAVEIQFVDINNGWLLIFNFSTQTANFLRTTDGGTNWVPFTGTGIFFFVDANTGWSFYGSGVNGSEPPFKILRTTNGGTDWTEQFSDNVAGGYNAIFFSDVNNGWVVGDSGKVVETTNGGTNWNYVTNSGINSNYRSKTVFFLDAENGWISSKDGAGNGIIRHTTDGGASWSTQVTPLTNSQGGNAIFSVYFIDDQNGWLTADYGRICHFAGTTSIGSDIENVHTFSLAQNFPNPFNPSTVISYQLPVAGYVSLKVYNLLGTEVAVIVDGFKPAGNYEFEFNASSLMSGVYFYKLTSGNFTEVRKMILMK